MALTDLSVRFVVDAGAAIAAIDRVAAAARALDVACQEMKTALEELDKAAPVNVEVQSG